MKNFKLLAFLLVLITVASCKKDDTSKDPTVSILGKWNGKIQVKISYKDGKKVDEYITDMADIYIEFRSNGTALEGTGKDLNEYVYHIQNNTLFISPAEIEEYKITNLTKNELILFGEEEWVSDENGIKYKDTYEISYKR